MKDDSIGRVIKRIEKEMPQVGFVGLRAVLEEEIEPAFTALEAENAAMREALGPFAAVNDWDAEFVKGSHHDDPSEIVFSPGPIPAPGESQERPLILRGDLRRSKASISPPTGKVLVDRDLLEMCIDLLRGEKPIDATKAAASIRRVVDLLKETP